MWRKLNFTQSFIFSSRKSKIGILWKFWQCDELNYLIYRGFSWYSIAAIHDDSEDKNLSWLYNYKLNELPHLSPEVNRSRTETGLQVDKLIQEATSCELEPLNTESQTVDNPANL